MTTRRRALAYVAASTCLAAMPWARSQPVQPKRILFVHGRAQQGKDPVALKEEWFASLLRGAAKSGMTIGSVEVAFPFYGDVLDSFSRQMDIPLTSEVGMRGLQDDDFLRFQYDVANAMRLARGISDSKVDEEYTGTRERGPQNWEWVHAILRALDKNAGGLGQAAIESFTRDVYLYTRRAGVQAEINRIVAAQLTEEPTIVVGHSLGSVVAYNVLRTDTRRLNIPLYVSLGSPLGIRAIRDELRPLRYPDRLGRWFNAFDPRDVVALYPLDQNNFPVRPAIENKGDIDNYTDNRHGIVAYLDDREVARQIAGEIRGQI